MSAAAAQELDNLLVASSCANDMLVYNKESVCGVFTINVLGKIVLFQHATVLIRSIFTARHTSVMFVVAR